MCGIPPIPYRKKKNHMRDYFTSTLPFHVVSVSAFEFVPGVVSMPRLAHWVRLCDAHASASVRTRWLSEEKKEYKYVCVVRQFKHLDMFSYIGVCYVCVCELNFPSLTLAVWIQMYMVCMLYYSLIWCVREKESLSDLSLRMCMWLTVHWPPEELILNMA